MVVLPQVAHGHVADQQNGDSANAALLHIDVLVVVSVMAWNTMTKAYDLLGPTRCHQYY